jgi:hypothetical protein
MYVEDAIIDKNTICNKPKKSKSRIKIEKNKLPLNFFKPLSIEI